jgi:hypothetical protein
MKRAAKSPVFLFLAVTGIIAALYYVSKPAAEGFKQKKVVIKKKTPSKK